MQDGAPSCVVRTPRSSMCSVQHRQSYDTDIRHPMSQDSSPDSWVEQKGSAASPRLSCYSCIPHPKCPQQHAWAGTPPATGRHHVVSHPSGVGRILRSHPPHPPSGFAYLPFPASQSPPSQRARPAAEESRMDGTEMGEARQNNRSTAGSDVGSKLLHHLRSSPPERTQTYLPMGRT